MQYKKSIIISAVIFATLTVYYSYYQIAKVARAQTAPADIQAKIDDRNASIAALQKEIDSYQVQIDSLGVQANSLKNTITSLDISKKKLEAQISITQDKIDNTNLEIGQINAHISKTADNIDTDHAVVAKLLSSVREYDDTSLIEILLAGKSLSETFTTVDNMANLEKSVSGKINDLKAAKSTLETQSKLTKQKKAELVALQKSLSGDRQLIVVNEAEKTSLLSQTKDTETNYKKVIADKTAQRAAFEQEILDYEKALHIAVNPNAIPQAGTGVLHWPLDKIKITQYFGNTDFATKNPQIYNGAGHTGVDFAASVGTRVLASLDGVVVGVGNTDLIRGCYSYGKWIMIKHPNGLSTLYAHLSLPLVTQGQSVSTGDVIGYSGATGYATGPHLHFGVYATQGVVISRFTNSLHCNNAVVPLADIKAYLNPLSYL